MELGNELGSGTREWDHGIVEWGQGTGSETWGMSLGMGSQNCGMGSGNGIM